MAKATVDATPESVPSGTFISVSWTGAPDGSVLMAVQGSDIRTRSIPSGKPSGSIAKWFAPITQGAMEITLHNGKGRELASDTITVV